MGFGVWGLGFGVWGLGFVAWGLRLGIGVCVKPFVMVLDFAPVAVGEDGVGGICDDVGGDGDVVMILLLLPLLLLQ